MCKCQDNIRKAVKERREKDGNTVNYVVFKLSSIGGVDSKELVTGQEIEIDYSYLNKKNERKDKCEKTFVAHNYCPWCGRKYKM